MNAEMLLLRLGESRAPSVDMGELRVLLKHIRDLEGLVGCLLEGLTKAKVTVDVPFREKGLLRTHGRPQDVQETWGDESA